MFGFKVLTWNSGYGKGAYLTSAKKVLLGGSPGHAAAELTIPKTDETKELLAEYNKDGNLVVREEKTLVAQPIDKEPFYEVKEVECYRIYFSFWGDVKSKKTREQHRMVDDIRDRIEEGEGIPVEYTEKGKLLFKEDQNKLSKVEWKGLIGGTYGSFGIERIQHLTGLSEAEISESKAKLEKLDELEHDKELILWHVKEISQKLNAFKTEEQKQQYLASEEVLDRLELDEVTSFHELCVKLNVMSTALTELRYELTSLGVQFGVNPDGLIAFPIHPYQTDGLDYKRILIEMANIANSVVPYHGLKMNCSTAVMRIVKAGINDTLKTKIKKAGYSMPSSNTFVETPQSVYDFSLNISEVLLHMNQKTDSKIKIMFENFNNKLQSFFTYIISFIFKPSKKQMLINAKSEYEVLLSNTKIALEKLDEEFDINNISEKVYNDMKSNGEVLIKFYDQKILETIELLKRINLKNKPECENKTLNITPKR